VAVLFRIPGFLRAFTGEAADVRIEGSPATVGAALEALWARHPGVRDRVVTEPGELRPHVNIFVGHENIRWTGGLATPVPAGSEISIVPAISGG
jgi:molybdopterin synthase sulfur carrier subunit